MFKHSLSGIKFLPDNFHVEPSFMIYMAKATAAVIQALRRAAKQIQHGAPYQWGHMGSCNCGHLAQTVTNRSKAEIHRQAMRSYGNWSEHLNDYCATSGLPFDHIIDEILKFGFNKTDLSHLEKLSDPDVLSRPPKHQRTLRYNLREHAVLYIKT